MTDALELWISLGAGALLLVFFVWQFLSGLPKYLRWGCGGVETPNCRQSWWCADCGVYVDLDEHLRCLRCRGDNVNPF